jgi:hypothetical protein
MFGFFALWVWLKGGFEPLVTDAARRIDVGFAIFGLYLANHLTDITRQNDAIFLSH